MNLTNKKYLVFDFDRTIDTLIIDWSTVIDGWVELAEKLTGEKNLKVTHNSYVFQIEIIKKIGQPAIDAFHEFTKTYEKENYSGHDPNMMLVNFIKDNQSKYQFYLWTSNHIDTITPALSDLGLTDVFTKVISRDVVNLPKPASEGFEQIFIPGTTKNDYVLIGDSENDRLAAKASGIDFIDVIDFEKLINE